MPRLLAALLLASVAARSTAAVPRLARPSLTLAGGAPSARLAPLVSAAASGAPSLPVAPTPLAAAPAPAALSPADAAAPAPRIVIVGGGIAGLSALHELARFGLDARLYEAEAELGGRMRTRWDAGTGLTVEAGAEFVNRTHDDLLEMMRELGIRPLRRDSVSRPRSFIYRGRPVEESRFQRRLFREAARPLAAIARDAETVRRAARERRADVLRAYDRLTIGEYLDRVAAPPILRAFVKAVVDSESGRDHRELSAVVLFECLSVDLARKRVAVLPDEDESYKIEGGAGGVVAALAGRYGASVDRRHRLTAVESEDGRRFRLTFRTPEGERVVEADHVVMALPPPSLKDVVIRMPGWTSALRRGVDGVVFGAHVKLTLFFRDRPWRKTGHSGAGLSDDGLAFWESSEGQPGPGGSITFLGRAAPLVEAAIRGPLMPGELASRLVHQLSAAIPGLKAAYRGFRADIWPRSYPFADTPGDPYAYILTWLDRREFGKFSPKPLGNFHWAGDLYSAKSPAYMDGAVQTGKDAARAIAAAVGFPTP